MSEVELDYLLNDLGRSFFEKFREFNFMPSQLTPSLK